MTRTTEKRDVQVALISYLRGLGCDYLLPLEALRVRNDDPRQPFLPAVTRDRIIALNPGLVTDANAPDVLHRLRCDRADMRGNGGCAETLRGHRIVYDAAARRASNSTLVGDDALGADRFHVPEDFASADGDNAG